MDDHPEPVTLFEGCFVDTPTPATLRILPSHILTVSNKTGLIISLCPSHLLPDHLSSLTPTAHHKCPPDSFFLPTFYDTHIHCPQYIYMGTALDKPLMEWLEAYAFKAEQRIDKDPEGLGRKVYGSLAKRLIREGTGGLLDSEPVVLAEELAKAGVRGYVGKVNMNRNSPPTYADASTEDSLSSTKDFIKAISHLSPFIKPIITPRFVPTCTAELLEGLGQLAESEGLMIQTHACESLEQVAFTKAMEDGNDDFVVLGRAKLLGPKTLLAHCTHLEPSHEETILKTQCAIAHCPLSNLYFSTKPLKTREAIDRGMKVGLGSDVAGGYALGIQHSMRSAVAVSRAREGIRREAGEEGSTLVVTWSESVYLATLGGAMALQLGETVGSFEVGKSFDAQLLHPGRLASAGDEGSGLDFFDDNSPWEERIERWWCSGDQRDRLQVYTQGALRYSRH